VGGRKKRTWLMNYSIVARRESGASGVDVLPEAGTNGGAGNRAGQPNAPGGDGGE